MRVLSILDGEEEEDNSRLSELLQLELTFLPMVSRPTTTIDWSVHVKSLFSDYSLLPTTAP
jgi:hypothetical protein